jgi:hypothetical protein
MNTNLTIDNALEILKKYSCSKIQTIKSAEEKDDLKEALLLITSLSEWENLGICANNAQEAFIALKSYLTAFGYKDNIVNQDIPILEESIYLKFNTQKMSFYMDSYSGEYRGVLVSIQGENDKLSGTYGHFPLDLFI